MIAAHILATILLGALWRLLRGATLWPGTAPIATATFAPMCAFAILPLWWVLDPGKFALALIVFGALSAMFLLVDADNGGNGKPIRRFGPFGLGYYLAGRFRPALWSAIGEPWLGGTWFGSASVASWIIYAWRLGA